MSRVGNSPVEVPSGVEVVDQRRRHHRQGQARPVRAFETTPDVTVAMEDGKVVVKPVDESKSARSMWGTTRSQIQNLVTGVSEGFTQGTWRSTASAIAPRFRARPSTCSSATATTSTIEIPEGISITCEKPTSIAIKGADKQQVGQVAAEIRGYRKPRALQGQGHQVRRGADPAQGRQEEVRPCGH